VQAAFGVPPHGPGDAGGKALAAALLDDDRLTRLAAAEMASDRRWWTPAVVRALLAAWQRHLEPAGTLLAAIDAAYAAAPALFGFTASGPLHRALAAEPALWEKVQDDALWRPILAALYAAPLAPWAPDALVRETALTPELLAHLRRSSDRATVAAWLWQCYRGEDAVAGRDAGLALAYLGETALAAKLAMGGEDRSRTRAIFAASSLDRSFALALDLDLNRAHDRTLDRALALALTLDRNRALDLARSLDRALESDRDLDSDRACDRARARARALDLDLDLDLNRSRLEEIAQAIERARARFGDDAEITAALTAAAGSLAEVRAFAAAGAAGVAAVWAALPRIAGVEDAPGQLPQLTLAGLTGRPGTVGSAGADDLPRLTLPPAPDAAARAALIAQLRGWLAGDLPPGQDPALGQRYAALVLAELVVLAAAHLPHLLAGLADPVDLTRYRVQAVLDRERPASALGRDFVEALATAYGATDAPLAATLVDWSLRNVVHDQGDWLRAWVTAGRTDIVERIHRLDAAAWPDFLALFSAATDAMQQALLQSAGWLLRLGRVPEEHGEALLATVLAGLAAPEPAVQAAARETLGYFAGTAQAAAARDALLSDLANRSATAGALSDLANRSTSAGKLSDLANRSTTATALARLTAKDAAPPAPVAATPAALVRWQVTGAEAGGARDDELAVTPARLALYDALAAALPDPPARLAACLAAGADDDGWGDYHSTIAVLIALTVQRHDGLLAALLDALEVALAGDKDAWPPRRIALAALAAAAGAMPDALNDALADRGGSELLTAAARDANSHNSRRFAVRALSHLRALTPAALATLRAAAGDLEPVQREAVAAVARFRHLAEDFDVDAALAELVAALHGPSAAGAYLAAGLLGALGSAPAARQQPGLRQRIEALLTAAYRAPGAQRTVYLLTGSSGGYSARGTVAAACLEALIRVTGLPEAPGAGRIERGWGG